jgi:hypothetical protein
VSERLLSSRNTFVLKYLFPAVWMLAFGHFAYSALRTLGQLSYHSGPGTVPAGLAWRVVLGWLLGTVLILWAAIPLKRVRLVDGALLVSNFRREVRIPLGAIRRVSQNRWLNWRPIAVELRTDLGVGTRFTFLPPDRLFRFRFRFWREDPEVAELRHLAGVARPRSPAPAP